MTGAEIKKYIINSGVRIWQVAKAWGINDGNFSRKLRNDFTEEETKKVFKIVSELKKDM